MAHVALYRKYRSQSFGDVIGQQHVTTVLQNAIRLGRISHAYLFCGPRGCGKTSTARLLARALNCQAADTPTPEPCGVCDMCKQIREGSAMDVVEMDAASETGIDDVREKIIENAKYAPAEARYKVYIIDEVHDLSAKAFDSLLKTIEEPPAHVVFVLATTEAHKVPITIRSRCQRMDFRRGTQEDLMGNIQRVLENESIKADEDAISAVARAAEGSFRDSLSLLEQALAYTDGNLTAESVYASIGSVGPQMLDDIIDSVSSDNMAEAFTKVAALVESGKDVKQTLVALQTHLRDLLVASISSGPEALTDVSAERYTRLKDQSARFTPQQMLRMLDILADAERDLRFTNQHRLLLERALWSVLPSNMAGEIAPTASPSAGSIPTTHPQPAQRVVQRPAETVRPADSISVQSPSTPVQTSQRPITAPPTPYAGAAPAITDYRFAGSLDIAILQKVWPNIRKQVLKDFPAAAGLITEEVYITAFDGKTVTLSFPDEFKRSRVDKPRGHSALEIAIATVTGVQGVKCRCIRQFDSPSHEEQHPETTSATAPDLTLPDERTAAQETLNTVEAAPPSRKANEQFLDLVIEELDGELLQEDQ